MKSLILGIFFLLSSVIGFSQYWAPIVNYGTAKTLGGDLVVSGRYMVYGLGISKNLKTGLKGSLMEMPDNTQDLKSIGDVNNLEGHFIVGANITPWVALIGKIGLYEQYQDVSTFSVNGANHYGYINTHTRTSYGGNLLFNVSGRWTISAGYSNFEKGIIGIGYRLDAKF